MHHWVILTHRTYVMKSFTANQAADGLILTIDFSPIKVLYSFKKAVSLIILLYDEPCISVHCSCTDLDQTIIL